MALKKIKSSRVLHGKDIEVVFDPEHPHFDHIPQFIAGGSYRCDVPWDYLERWLQTHSAGAQKVDLDPDFQRGHVWTPQQQSLFVEYMLQGGTSAYTLLWNHTGWSRSPEPYSDLPEDTLVLVDGKQRLEAVRGFLTDRVPAFGARFSAYEGQMRLMCRFQMQVNNLQTREELLTWYLQTNDGGVVHTAEELARVRALLKKARKR